MFHVRPVCAKVIKDLTITPSGSMFAKQMVRRTAIEEIAIVAINRVRTRFKNTQTDGQGRKSKPLQKGTRGFMSAHDDPRFTSIGKVVGRKVKVRVDKDYPTVKRKLGAKPVKNFSLTGAAWRSLKAKVKQIPGGWDIDLKFTGQVKTGKIVKGTKLKQVRRKRKKGGGFVKVKRRVPKMVTVSVRNRVKAEQFQLRSEAGISLLSFNDDERNEMAQIYLEAIEFFTAAGSRSKKVRRRFRRTRK